MGGGAYFANNPGCRQASIDDHIISCEVVAGEVTHGLRRKLQCDQKLRNFIRTVVRKKVCCPETMERRNFVPVFQAS